MGNSLAGNSHQPEENQRNVPTISPSDIVRPSKRHVKESTSTSSLTTTKEPKPKRKRLKTTSQYIYDALFVHGENSDVTIKSLGREWKLHKVYLRQAGYFQSMFHSQWKESSMEVINLQIPDDNINEDALDITFGSLYSEDVLICPSKVVPILAAASLIQLDGLMQQCAEVMKETISHENVCLYYKTACTYGLVEVSDTCISWLETNLMIAQSMSLLKEIDPKLISTVISSPNLIVIQIEMDIYTILKKWLFLHLNPEFSGEYKAILSAADKFFREEGKRAKICFLDSQTGEAFVPVFRSLRLQHIIRDFVSCRELEKDMIIPSNWLLPLYRQQWFSMLRVEQNLDSGPKNVDKDEFDSNGLRCGRLLMRDTEHCWRWNGYNFGLDLLVSYSTPAPRRISLRRNVQSQRCSASVSLASVRHILFRIQVASVNEKGHTVLRYTTGSTPLTLEKEEELVVLMIDKDGIPEDVAKKGGGWNSCFPLLITATFQLVNAPASAEMLESGYPIMEIPQLNAAPTLGESEAIEPDIDEHEIE